MALTEHQKAALWEIHTGTQFAPGSKAHAFADAIESEATAPLLERIAALEAQVEQATEQQTLLRKALLETGAFKAAPLIGKVEQAAQPVEFDIRCEVCGGDGNDPKDNNYGCSVCGGSGFNSRKLYTSPPKSAPLTNAQKAELVANWFAEEWAQEKAFGVLDDYETMQRIGAPATVEKG